MHLNNALTVTGAIIITLASLKAKEVNKVQDWLSLLVHGIFLQFQYLSCCGCCKSGTTHSVHPEISSDYLLCKILLVLRHLLCRSHAVTSGNAVKIGMKMNMMENEYHSHDGNHLCFLKQKLLFNVSCSQKSFWIENKYIGDYISEKQKCIMQTEAV